MTRARVLVVGGGMAGVSIACELSLDHDVVLLEAEATLAMHSTGRSAAVLIPDYGPEPVRALTKASEHRFDQLSVELSADPFLSPRGRLVVAWDEPSVVALVRALKEPDARLRPIPVSAAMAICPVLSKEQLRMAAFDDTTRDIDVMGLHAAYVRGLRRRGGHVELRASVAGVKRTGQGWRLTARDGRSWEGDLIVNAAGAWGDELPILCGGGGHELQPRRRTIVIASSPAVDQSWPFVDDAAQRWYFKPESGGVLLSPEDETAVPPGDPKPDPLDVATALERVNGSTTLQLRSVRTVWAGLRTFSPDGCPVVGWHPVVDGLFCFLGQGGYGIQMAPALAALGASLVRGTTLSDDDSRLKAALDPGRGPAVAPLADAPSVVAQT